MSRTSSRFWNALGSCVLTLGLGSAAAAATIDVSYFGRNDAVAAKAALDAFQAGTDGMIGPKQQMKSGRRRGLREARRLERLDRLDQSDDQGRQLRRPGGIGSGGSAVNGGRAAGPQRRSLGLGPLQHQRRRRQLARQQRHARHALGRRAARKFNALAFLLHRRADVGAKFTIKVGDTLFSQVIGASGRLANGSIQLVRILLPEAVASPPSSCARPAERRLRHRRRHRRPRRPGAAAAGGAAAVLGRRRAVRRQPAPPRRRLRSDAGLRRETEAWDLWSHA